MISQHDELSRTLDSIHETMEVAKGKLKHATVLLNITPLRPILHNMRRTSKYAILRHFWMMRDSLIQASEHENAEILGMPTPAFVVKTHPY